nr:hypothetical protein Hi04_10k_c2089_00067 [uncultured bacterium]
MSNHLQTPRLTPLSGFGLGNGLPTLAQFEQVARERWIYSNEIRTADNRTYRLFNYAKQTQYERVWNEVTTVSRGLIVCVETGEIVAAPMAKFYNLGETIGPDNVAGVKPGRFEAFVKLDGSLGIGYRLDGRFRWATRGSFTSPQSAVAQKMWDERYAQHDVLMHTEFDHITPSVEIIHPETRVVCRYDYQDLVLISARNRFTGEDISYAELVRIGARLGMRVVERIDGDDVDALQARAQTLHSDEEGYVLKWADGYRVKVKGEAYKRVHRLLAGISAKQIAIDWNDGQVAEVLRNLPEEYRGETEEMVRQLDEDLAELVCLTESLYEQGRSAPDQKAYALWVKAQEPRLSPILFLRRPRAGETDEKALVRALVRQRALVRDEFIQSGRVMTVTDRLDDA